MVELTELAEDVPTCNVGVQTSLEVDERGSVRLRNVDISVMSRPAASENARGVRSVPSGTERLTRTHLPGIDARIGIVLGFPESVRRSPC